MEEQEVEHKEGETSCMSITNFRQKIIRMKRKIKSYTDSLTDLAAQCEKELVTSLIRNRQNFLEKETIQCTQSNEYLLYIIIAEFQQGSETFVRPSIVYLFNILKKNLKITLEGRSTTK